MTVRNSFKIINCLEGCHFLDWSWRFLWSFFHELLIYHHLVHNPLQIRCRNWNSEPIVKSGFFTFFYLLLIKIYSWNCNNIGLLDNFDAFASFKTIHGWHIQIHKNQIKVLHTCHLVSLTTIISKLNISFFNRTRINQHSFEYNLLGFVIICN